MFEIVKNFAQKHSNSTIKWLDNTLTSTTLSFSLSKICSNFWVSHPLLKIALDKFSAKLVSNEIRIVSFFYGLSGSIVKNIDDLSDDIPEELDITENNTLIPISMRYYSETRYDYNIKSFLEAANKFCIDSMDGIEYIGNRTTILVADSLSNKNKYMITEYFQEKMTGILLPLATLTAQIIVPYNSEAITKIIFKTDHPSRLKKAVATGTVGFIITDLIKIMDENQKSWTVFASEKILDLLSSVTLLCSQVAEQHKNITTEESLREGDISPDEVAQDLVGACDLS